MLEKLRAWLNGDRDFNEGKLLYFTVGKNLHLKTLLVQVGKTPISYQMLQEELMDICKQMKAAGDGKAASVATIPIAAKETPNKALYDACLDEAHVKYKEAMNPRAELLRKCQSLRVVNINSPDLIEQRKQLAIDVVSHYTHASLLFDRADYVKQHGKLPEAPEEPKSIPVAALHDCMVFYTLEQYRKNYNKLKSRSKTPERVAMMQRYEGDIKTLEERWHLLKLEHGK